ncbi:MAG TPA: Hpt domain-containing protein [Acidimicrobiia bacterium]|nr:Hpt domain-containing protein [Acidimicrobiia bacterium]
MAPPLSSDATAVTRQPGPILDLERLTFLTEICAAPGSPAAIGALVDAFVEDGRLRVVEMEGSLRAGDLGTLAHLANELKGSSGTIGAVGLADAATRLLRQARVALRGQAVEPSESADHDVGQLLGLVATEFQRAETALRAAVPGRL